MAKEIFAGRKNKKYKIVISGDALSKKNLGPLLKEHNKVLVISDNGVPLNIIKKVSSISKTFSKVLQSKRDKVKQRTV